VEVPICHPKGSELCQVQLSQASRVLLQRSLWFGVREAGL